MNEVHPNLFFGIFFHAIGATFAATCYTHQKRVKGWSWETYWLAQASICWFVLPIVVPFLLIPQMRELLAAAPRDAMLNSFLLGAAYGIGGTAFGIAIRHIGFSLTYAIAVGLSAVLGTIIPSMWKHELIEKLSKVGGSWILCGIIVGTLGIALCGLAGRMKEKDLAQKGEKVQFNLGTGLLLSLLAGVLSAVYGFAIEAGAPIAKLAEEKFGAGVWNGLPTYIFSNSGAFLTTAIYCIFLINKHNTAGEYTRPMPTTETPRPSLPLNYLFAFLTGVFWYGQFFFYNLGHVHLNENFKFSSWAIHMIMLVLISNVVGVVLREWFNCRRLTRRWLNVALAVLVVSVLLLTNGNRLGEKASKAKAAEAPAAAAVTATE